MKLKVIITGVTGMVGEGVLHECVLHPDVSEILAISRKPCAYKHSKIKEIVHKDFLDITSIQEQLKGYDACFFCLGVSSIGMNEGDYTRLTHTLTMHFAEVLSKQRPNLTFCYVSGASTDSSEEGRSMWARVKGKTENDLIKLFSKAYMFRPGYMHPTPGLRNVNKFYKYVTWLYPVFRYVLGKGSTLKELGLAMIHAASRGYDKKILEVKDIIKLAK
ncbi:MAG: NAD-dependent epimerase/dehydratase family protein [Bacteroidia bacterium]|nr:NAD-dependent epimerase/dehydratase family protein [Bacteroidia bacterium]